MRDLPAIGSELGGYRLESLIARGGMGVVYLAEDVRMRRTVALKVLASELGENEPFRARFLHESRVAITPFRNALRLAGTLELAGLDPTVRPGRIAAITAAARQSLAGWPANPGNGRAWAGFRPITPDGLPVIGRLPGFENLLVASGHAMLGVTLAPVTGEAIAELLTNDQPIERLAPFDPGRFSRRP